MRIGLIDVDGHRFPNLCLMKQIGRASCRERVFRAV